MFLIWAKKQHNHNSKTTGNTYTKEQKMIPVGHYINVRTF